MGLALIGLGTALPDVAVTQAESLRIAQVLAGLEGDQVDLLPALYRQTGIVKRHLAFDLALVRDVLDGTRQSGSCFLPGGNGSAQGPTTAERMHHYVQLAGPLALSAAQQALEESGLAPADLTHLITVSCTGFSAPGVDVELIKKLNLAPSVERTHLGFMGCHGAFNGLRVARAFADSRPDARVLLCAVELCGLHYHYSWNPKKMVANALFADGAAAAIGVPGKIAPESWQAAASGSCVFPDSEYAMTWNIGDHGFEMTLATRVPDLIARHLRPWFEEWLGQQGLVLKHICSWAIHPGGPRILTAVEEALGLDLVATAVSREVLAECGNMSSPTVLFLIDRLRRRDAARPCVALGFGPGLTVEATLFL